MFADIATVKLGDETVNVRRLTLAEIDQHRAVFAKSGATVDEAARKLVAEHVTRADGEPVPVDELSFRQLQTLVVELVGIPEGSGISDFIGLLC